MLQHKYGTFIMRLEFCVGALEIDLLAAKFLSLFPRIFTQYNNVCITAIKHIT